MFFMLGKPIGNQFEAKRGKYDSTNVKWYNIILQKAPPYTQLR
jgi:hypothetical protein